MRRYLFLILVFLSSIFIYLQAHGQSDFLNQTSSSSGSVVISSSGSPCDVELSKTITNISYPNGCNSGGANITCCPLSQLGMGFITYGDTLGDDLNDLIVSWTVDCSSKKVTFTGSGESACTAQATTLCGDVSNTGGSPKTCNLPSGSVCCSSTSSSSSGATLSTKTIYIIVDGPGACTRFIATTDPITGIVSVSPTENSITKIDGHIVGIGMGEGINCPGPLGHYHGTLGGQADPNPGNCGWGHVTEIENVSHRLADISYAIQTESLVLIDIEKEPPDYKQALFHAHSAAADLDDLRKIIRNPMETKIGAGKAKAISDKLGKAVKDDKSVADALTPLPTKRDLNIDTAIAIKINKTLMIKQEACTILIDAEAKAAAMTAMGE